MKIYPIKLVREREQDQRMQAFAQKRADLATARLQPLKPKLNKLLRQGTEDAYTMEQKWFVMDRILSLVAEAVAPFSACMAGCDACCHSSIPVSRPEAERIAQHTGRQHASPALVGNVKNPEYFGIPCPFLKKGRCSIYAVRPLACKWHYNLDSTNILCSPCADGMPVRLPLWNRVELERVAFEIFGASVIEGADIRDFFPQQ